MSAGATPRSSFLQAAVRGVSAAGVVADTLKYQGELGDRGRAEHERIQIVQPHAAVDRIDGEGERQPRFDQAIQIASWGSKSILAREILRGSATWCAGIGQLHTSCMALAQ